MVDPSALESKHRGVDAKPLGRREKRKIETRRALLEAAYRLFTERGYEATTMDDVADAAGVSRRTAFRYFPTKDQLVFPERDRRLAFFRAILTEDPKAEPWAAIRHAVLGMAREYEGDKEWLLTQDRLVQASPELAGLEIRFDKAFEDAIVERLRNGERTKAAARRARVLGAAVMGVIRASLREWLDAGATDALQRLGEEGFEVLERGIR